MNLIKGVVRGEGFVRLVQALVFLETFLEMSSGIVFVVQKQQCKECGQWYATVLIHMLRSICISSMYV